MKGAAERRDFALIAIKLLERLADDSAVMNLAMPSEQG
jgi:hypothetical protein